MYKPSVKEKPLVYRWIDEVNQSVGPAGEDAVTPVRGCRMEKLEAEEAVPESPDMKGASQTKKKQDG